MAQIFLSTNIKFLRKKKGENQTQLGFAIQKGQKTIGNWETGYSEPSIEEIAAISNYFGISIDDLVLKNLSEEEVIHKNALREASNSAYGTNWKEKYFEVLEKYNNCLESKQQTA